MRATMTEGKPVDIKIIIKKD